ncbi:LysM peptidoglycan-binding domain-containing protein [Ancylomarina sp. DW003]|nr:RHS repeat-associated core domain-containing protein [Ancylomarina sp. DW003]MDE5420597.1 LysM peptidoglycan-binding domain-containing protein [Ancylomarina sp. DW003]
MTVNPVAVIRYQLDNHLGSASLELDETADIITYEEYHPFGTTSYRSGRTETETSQKRYKYVGKERDEETGLYYYGFRYYAAWLCRFVSVDPLQFDYPYYTPFQYAGNKPITYIDLDGLEEFKLDDLYERPKVKVDNTYVAQSLPVNIVRSNNDDYSRLGQGTLGVVNIISGLSIVVAGIAIAASTSVTIAGALGGVAMIMAGFSQMAIGVAQVTDASASQEKHVPDVGGISELVGYGITKKTGNPIYQTVGSGVDLLSSLGFGAAKSVPVLSNLKDLGRVGIPQDLNQTLEFSKNLVIGGNDANTTVNIIRGIGDVVEYYGDSSVQSEGDLTQGISIMNINEYTLHHRIYPGETLSSIAKQYNVTIGDLVKLNSIENPDLIYAGDDIKVAESTTIQYW